MGVARLVRGDETAVGEANGPGDPPATTLPLGWALLATLLVAVTVISGIARLAAPEGHGDGQRHAVPPAFQLDLNRATSAQLQALPDIGPQLANRIVAHREQRGPFTEVDQLLEVRGFGVKTLEGLREMLIISEPTGVPPVKHRAGAFVHADH